VKNFFPSDGAGLQKASCACGGDCQRCQQDRGHPALQAKLQVSTPGDEYEQEADRVATQVMRMPDAGLHDACACGGGCPRCSAKKDSAREVDGAANGVASIQTSTAKKTSSESSPSHSEAHFANEAESTPLPPRVHDVLKSPGQTLDAETRAFMEPRFGYDFSNVRIHNDTLAHRSSENIRALAYTHGDHVVFGARQYRPQTNAGKELLAHELAHVKQQSKSGTVGRLFRRIDYALPHFSPTNAIDTFLAGRKLALTTPTVNGTPLPDDAIVAGTIIYKALNLDADGALIKTSGDEGVCSYDEPIVNISANIALVEAPNRDKWSGQTSGSNFVGRNSNCRGKGNIPVEAIGNPNATTICENARSNEMEHYDDLKALSTQHLGRLLTLLRSFSDKTATGDEDCQKKLQAALDQKAGEIIGGFLRALRAKINTRDVQPGPHHFIPQVHIAEDCRRIDIVVKRST
jgi:hypothetical protein